MEEVTAAKTEPCGVVTLQLAGDADTFIQDALTLDIKHLGNRNVAAQREMLKEWKFIQVSIECSVPATANTFIVVDMHTEMDMGYLQYIQDAEKLSLTLYLHQREVMLMMMEMAGISAQWQGLNKTSHWFNDLVLGFGGHVTILAQVRNALSAVIKCLGINKHISQLWDAIVEVVSQELDLLQVNSVIATYRERGSQTVECQEIGLQSPLMRPWDIEFAACGKDRCTPKWYEFHTRTTAQGVKVKCRRCSWVSEVVRSASGDLCNSFKAEME
ncbi:hypothetical protein OG21DRAFT_1527013 [Imleria badia]|nr:hypothetical protein OG21DRAFT_1527013 [Imleria badia]